MVSAGREELGAELEELRAGQPLNGQAAATTATMSTAAPTPTLSTATTPTQPMSIAPGGHHHHHQHQHHHHHHQQQQQQQQQHHSQQLQEQEQEQEQHQQLQHQSPPLFGDDLPGAGRRSHSSSAREGGNYLSQLYSRPLVTTLSGFSQVANLVGNPYELINNVDEFMRRAASGPGPARHNGARQQQAGASESNFAHTLNQNRRSGTPASPPGQELDTFVAGSACGSSPASTADRRHQDELDFSQHRMPVPALPPIESSKKRGRLPALTIEDYENNYRRQASDLDLIERVFYGSMACNQLRAALWPYLFGLVEHRGRFEAISARQGPAGAPKSAAAAAAKVYMFVEHEANSDRWRQLQDLYSLYQSQWKAILPDQETRFSTFRERKSLIERDVIRCDRLHPFYAERPHNLASLTNLLMTYMMYDFDIGYVQGMSDLAAPILYMYNGDIVKSFWVFVEAMKLFRRNFELTQKTIHFQLNCLSELVRSTDPIFAQYLDEHESSNCFFAFRAIVCQFKRELMKDEEDEYAKVLFLWDTTWCVARRRHLRAQAAAGPDGQAAGAAAAAAAQLEPASLQADEEYLHVDSSQSDTVRYKLSDTELFVLALCLSMIRRERDLIMASQLDGTDIHLHFIDPKLAKNLSDFIEHAINIHSYLETDFDLRQLTQCKSRATRPGSPTHGGQPGGRAAPGLGGAAGAGQHQAGPDMVAESPAACSDGYDLLSDFLIINAASGT